MTGGLSNTFREKWSLLALFLWMLPGSMNAQQLLNLDFEKTSVEGISRPWGWSLGSHTATAVGLDSLVKHKGKYSLKQSADSEEAEVQLLGFSIEPYELWNNTITVQGWIKTDRLSGAAYFTLGYSPGSDEPGPMEANLTSEKVTGTADWQRVSANSLVPKSARMVHLTLQHEGPGTAWFDDFSLIVNGREMQQVQVAEPFSEEQLQWLSEASYPLKSVDATSNENPPPSAFDDLAPFKRLVGDARIIALGESTHGTSEFFRLKHRLLEYAVKELGVRVFAIEDNQLVVERVNKYVLGGPGNARSSMYGMFSVWQNEEIHNLIRWVRTYNDNHSEDMVAFVGFDLQNLALPIDSLYTFLERRSPPLYITVSELLDDLKKDGAQSYMMPDSTKLSWFENAVSVLEQLKNREQDWLAGAKNKADSLQIFWGIQYANLVKQYAENAYKGHMSLYRDVAMAENISWILSMHPPATRILIWAHDNHISRGEHPDSTLNMYFGISMGAHLAKKFGNNYKAFGISTYQGAYWAQIGYMNFRQLSCPLHTGPKGSLDEALHQVTIRKNTPALLLDLSHARDLDWLTRPIPVRFANHVNIEYGYWTRFSIPYQFDGIFFIDKTTAARSYLKN